MDRESVHSVSVYTEYTVVHTAGIELAGSTLTVSMDRRFQEHKDNGIKYGVHWTANIEMMTILEETNNGNGNESNRVVCSVRTVYRLQLDYNRFSKDACF